MNRRRIAGPCFRQSLGWDRQGGRRWTITPERLQFAPGSLLFLNTVLRTWSLIVLGGCWFFFCPSTLYVVLLVGPCWSWNKAIYMLMVLVHSSNNSSPVSVLGHSSVVFEGNVWVQKRILVFTMNPSHVYCIVSISEYNLKSYVHTEY